MMGHADTADTVPKACEDEVRLRGALPLIESGQLADSYDTLHGIRFITLMLQTIPQGLTDDERLHYSLYLFDAFILGNLHELSDRAAKALAQGRIAAAVDALAWMERLLRLMHDASGLVTPLGAGTSVVEETSAALAFRQGFERLCRSLQDHFVAQEAPPDDESSTLQAQLFHQSKNIILQVRESLFNERRAPPQGVDPSLAEAHLRCVAAAALGIRLNSDTYINQFCLLHQLPELLTPLVLRSFDTIERRMGNGASAARSARLAGDLLFLITASLWPLIELLQPRAYYAFRENLGATSGSSSAAIRGKLLTSAYVRLAKAFVDHEAGAADEQDAGLAGQIARIRRLIYRWRGLHMALPRNVLGSNGTKSLMGSPDALKAVETMADSFSKRDPLTTRFGSVSDQDFPQGSAAAALDVWLLTTTGTAAQQRFRQVQERTGPWRKTQKAP